MFFFEGLIRIPCRGCSAAHVLAEEGEALGSHVRDRPSFPLRVPARVRAGMLATNGLTSPSSSSLDLPVMRKSSA